MSHNSLVSIIVIFFNAQPFIAETIDSILAQTYVDWELLLVDDGSTDGSTDVAQRYVQRYPSKIRYLAHPGHQNRGMSATRNLGIHHAKGQFITFLDADDIWLSNTLVDQLEILENNPEAAMVYGPIQWWYSWTGLTEDIEKDFIDIPSVLVGHADVHFDSLIKPPVLLLLLLKGYITISGMLIRRHVLEHIGGFEESFRGLFEDQVFCSKICLHYPVYAASNCWYKYRQHSNSCCATIQKNKEIHAARLAYLSWLEKYLIKEVFWSSLSWKIISKEKRSYTYLIKSFLSIKRQQLNHLLEKFTNRLA